MALDRTNGAWWAAAAVGGLAAARLALRERGSWARSPSHYRDGLLDILAQLRAQQWDYWTSHWQMDGESFYGDHLLFERLYTEPLTTEIDALAERIVAQFGPEAVDARPSVVRTTGIVAASSVQADPFRRALRFEKGLQAAIRRAYDAGNASGELTLGMDDFLMALANAHETNIYLLTQRLKERQADG